MEEPASPAPIDPAVESKRVRINIILTVVVPILIGIVVTTLLVGRSNVDQIWQYFVAIAVFATPAAIGYVIALRWRKQSPGIFVLIGIGMSIVSLIALGALAFGGCMLVLS